jgi:hypothetical protein
MDLRRLRAGEWIAGAGGVLLLVSLFLPWYEGTQALTRSVAPLEEGDFDFTGWEALSGLDIVFALAALLAIAMAVVVATQRTGAMGIALSGLVTLASMLAGVLVLYRFLKVPDIEVVRGGASVAEFTESDRELGVWLALAGCAAMFVGGLTSMRDERITGDTRTIEQSDVEKLPAPKVGA